MMRKKNDKKKRNSQINREMIEKHDKKMKKEETIDLQDLNSKTLNDALKEAGLNVDSSPFADMERMINSNEAIRELVDIKNIRMKTNVTDEQHKIIVMLYGSYKTLLYQYGIDFKGLRSILDEFIEIAPSINGKRSEQYVTAHQAVAQAMTSMNKPNNQIRDGSEMKQ